MEQNELSVDLIDQKRFAAAIREAMDCLDRAASCYKLSEKSYYLETRRLLEESAKSLDEGKKITFDELLKHAFTEYVALDLKPGDPNNCVGNGQHSGIECQCDGCDYLIECCHVPGPDQERNAPSDNPWWMKNT